MGTLIAPNPGEDVLAQHVFDIANLLNGTVTGENIPVALIDYNSTGYPFRARNQSTSATAPIAKFSANTGASEVTILDITAAGVNIRGSGTTLLKGPLFFDVEAYANASDLNADGTFKVDVSATTAINAAAAAFKAATISGNSLNGASWNRGRTLRLNSPVYTISSPINWTLMREGVITSTAGQSLFYCGNSWTAAGGSTIAAIDSPMIDMTGSLGLSVVNIQANAQPLLGPATTSPSIKPAVGWLVASTESWNGSAWSGGGADSTGMTFRGCAASGWFRNSGWAFVNSVIHEMHGCGGTIYTNSSAARAFYAGRTTLTSAGAPHNGGALDSPFLPTTGSPTTNQQRMCRTEVAAGNIHCFQTEFHDLAGYTDTVNNPSNTGQDALASTVLLYKVIGFDLNDAPLSGSGVAMIEAQGFASNIALKGVEAYNDAVNRSGSDPNYVFWNNGCVLATPVSGLAIRDCVLNHPVAVAVIGGVSNAAYNGLRVENNLHTSGAIFNTNSSFSGTVTDEYLANAYIECAGRAVTVGGSIAATVELQSPGTVTVSASGTNKARTYSTDGLVTARAFRANGTALSAGSIQIDASNGAGKWGTGTTVTAVNATDYGGSFEITAAGTPGASPTTTIVFATTWATQPRGAIVQMNSGTGVSTSVVCFVQNSGRPSTGSLIFSPLFTPAAGSTYIFNFQVIP